MTRKNNYKAVLAPPGAEFGNIAQQWCDLCGEKGVGWLDVPLQVYPLKRHSCAWPLRKFGVAKLWLCEEHQESVRAEKSI